MMPTKLGLAAIIVMVLICFVPITLLWAFAIFMIIVSFLNSYVSGMSSFMFLIPSIILLFMGGVGLVGLVQMMVHIFRKGYQRASTSTVIKLYAGIVSLTILSILMIMAMGFSSAVFVFVKPIICGMILILLTTRKQSAQSASMFDDQII
jgi:hypothetical protein